MHVKTSTMIRRKMVKKMSRTTFDKDKLDKREIITKCIGYRQKQKNWSIPRTRIKITKKKPKK